MFVNTNPLYREEPCKTALNQCKGMPFRWTLNPYMGCVHRCTYCYVRAYEKRADRPFDERYGTLDPGQDQRGAGAALGAAQAVLAARDAWRSAPRPTRISRPRASTS